MWTCLTVRCWSGVLCGSQRAEWPAAGQPMSENNETRGHWEGRRCSLPKSCVEECFSTSLHEGAPVSHLYFVLVMILSYKTARLLQTVQHVLFLASVLENESTRLTAVELKHFIVTGLKNLFGEVSPSKVHLFRFNQIGLICSFFLYVPSTPTILHLCFPGRGSIELWPVEIWWEDTHGFFTCGQQVSEGTIELKI